MNCNIFISELKERVQKSKYLEWYVNLMQTRMHIDRDVYVEKHHILPKCVCPRHKGINSKDNIVLLTAKEHYIAHYLLIKIFTEGHAAYLLNHAFAIMRTSPSGLRQLSSRQIERCRIAARNHPVKWTKEFRSKRKLTILHSQAIREDAERTRIQNAKQLVGNGFIPSQTAKYTPKRAGRKWTAEQKRAKSIQMRGRKLPDIVKAKMILSHNAREITPEERKELSNRMKRIRALQTASKE